MELENTIICAQFFAGNLVCIHNERNGKRKMKEMKRNDDTTKYNDRIYKKECQGN